MNQSNDFIFRYKHKTKLAIPVAWLNDGISDCVSGEDELNTLWPTCMLSHISRPVPDNTTCKNVFLCNQVSQEFLELDRLCDGKEDCGEEGSVCLASRPTPKLFVSPLYVQGYRFIFYCLPGLSELERFTDPCVEGTFISTDQPLLGLTKFPKLKIPDAVINCANVFGELYVYLSCLGRCIHSTCVLEPLRHDSCSENFPQKVFTLAKDGYLTFVINHREEYHNRFFQCKNRNCINFDQVCNLANDCGDGSDEAGCLNHFQCYTSKFYIPHVKKCDGIIDCMDYSDECNRDCGKEIISGIVLKVLAWSIGGAGVLMNFASLCYVIREPWKKRNAALTNQTFKILINVGDLMTGLYLLLIALMDSVVFGESYCQKQLSWLTSDTCALLGIINTVGASLSLLSMTTLSVFRVVSINMNGIDSIGSVRSKVMVTATIIAAFSATIACAPLFSTWDDFYVNGMAYNKNMSLFTGVANKKSHLDVIDAYFGKISRRDISWKDINAFVDLMFTDNYGKIIRRKIHFYGNEGVCLFKYFVKANDPQKIYVWMILTVNFICFLLITISYIVINKRAKQTRNIVLNMMPSINSTKMELETDRLQRRITRIIVTDLVCWIPFLFMCVLHSSEVIDMTFLYSISSVIILPINSFVNPLIYDDFIMGKLRGVKRFIRSRSLIGSKHMSLSVVKVRIHADNF